MCASACTCYIYRNRHQQLFPAEKIIQHEPEQAIDRRPMTDENGNYNGKADRRGVDRPPPPPPSLCTPPSISKTTPLATTRLKNKTHLTNKPNQERLRLRVAIFARDAPYTKKRSPPPRSPPLPSQPPPPIPQTVAWYEPSHSLRVPTQTRQRACMQPPMHPNPAINRSLRESGQCEKYTDIAVGNTHTLTPTLTMYIKAHIREAQTEQGVAPPANRTPRANPIATPSANIRRIV